MKSNFPAIKFQSENPPKFEVYNVQRRVSWDDVGPVYDADGPGTTSDCTSGPAYCQDGPNDGHDDGAWLHGLYEAGKRGWDENIL